MKYYLIYNIIILKKEKQLFRLEIKNLQKKRLYSLLNGVFFYVIIANVSSAKLTNKWDSWEVVKMNWDFTILIAIIVLFLIISKKRIKIHHRHHLNTCQSTYLDWQV